MEPKNPPQAPEPAPIVPFRDEQSWPESAAPVLEPAKDVVPYYGLRWIFIGGQGLRAGWSVLMFLVLTFLFLLLLGSAFSRIGRALHLKLDPFSAGTTILQEGTFFLSLLAAAAIVALIEHRRILDYNLAGPRRLTHFFSGLVAGFAALSVLVGSLAWGGWLHFGPAALTGGRVFEFAALWAMGFLLVGLCEEGGFRGYLQSTLTRGINFWWALGTIGIFCAVGLFNTKANGPVGVYAMALLGLGPCLLLHLKRAPGSGFWQAAWVTSTAFGFIHTGNTGESWIGIFAAGFIGFVFCVSIRLTGSAWWAIGCHAAWDWAETFFYGTADSGMAPKGHFLTTTPAGNVLWSGGSNGPEGSLLVLPVVLLLLLVLLGIYGRGQATALTISPPEKTAL